MSKSEFTLEISALFLPFAWANWAIRELTWLLFHPPEIRERQVQKKASKRSEEWEIGTLKLASKTLLSRFSIYLDTLTMASKWLKIQAELHVWSRMQSHVQSSVTFLALLEPIEETSQVLERAEDAEFKQMALRRPIGRFARDFAPFIRLYLSIPSDDQSMSLLIGFWWHTV